MRKLIVLQDVPELEQKFLELVHISIKMRRAQKKFRQSYLGADLEKRRYWEEKMDTSIDELKLKEDHTFITELDLQIQNK